MFVVVIEQTWSLLLITLLSNGRDKKSSKYKIIIYHKCYEGNKQGTDMKSTSRVGIGQIGYSTDRGAWGATVHGVAKSWRRLSDFTSLVSNAGGAGAK